MNLKCIDILAVNETRLDDTIFSDDVTVPGYALERNNRNRGGGGVARYFRNTIMNVFNIMNVYWLSGKYGVRGAECGKCRVWKTRSVENKSLQNGKLNNDTSPLFFDISSLIRHIQRIGLNDDAFLLGRLAKS